MQFNSSRNSRCCDACSVFDNKFSLAKKYEELTEKGKSWSMHTCQGWGVTHLAPTLNGKKQYLEENILWENQITFSDFRTLSSVGIGLRKHVSIVLLASKNTLASGWGPLE
jgi:hypothetical protein